MYGSLAKSNPRRPYMADHTWIWQCGHGFGHAVLWTARPNLFVAGRHRVRLITGTTHIYPLKRKKKPHPRALRAIARPDKPKPSAGGHVWPPPAKSSPRAPRHGRPQLDLAVPPNMAIAGQVRLSPTVRGWPGLVYRGWTWLAATRFGREFFKKKF